MLVSTKNVCACQTVRWVSIPPAPLRGAPAPCPPRSWARLDQIRLTLSLRDWGLGEWARENQRWVLNLFWSHQTNTEGSLEWLCTLSCGFCLSLLGVCPTARIAEQFRSCLWNQYPSFKAQLYSSLCDLGNLLNFCSPQFLYLKCR